LSPWVKWRTEEYLSHLLHIWHVENVTKSAYVEKWAPANDLPLFLELDLVLDLALDHLEHLHPLRGVWWYHLSRH